MSSLIEQIQDRTTTADASLRVLEIDDGDADAVLDALASETGRATFRTLFEDPATPSEVGRRVDTSVQNVHYHLSNLEEAGLVEPVDTVYSEKGNEMTVYGPANDPLVFVGDESTRPRIQQSITEAVGGLGILALASLLIQWGAERLLASGAGASGAIGPASANASASPPKGTVAWTVFEVVEPGLLFFLGCLSVVGLYALARS